MITFDFALNDNHYDMDKYKILYSKYSILYYRQFICVQIFFQSLTSAIAASVPLGIRRFHTR